MKRIALYGFLLAFVTVPAFSQLPVTRRETLVGKSAAPFSAKDHNGKPAGTNAFAGRVIVVKVWATWCKPCVEEMPRIEREIWQRFKPDVALIAVAMGETPHAVREFNKQAKLTFPLVADPLLAISREYGGGEKGGVPRTYVIDRSGVIVYETKGYSEKRFLDTIDAVERAVARR